VLQQTVPEPGSLALVSIAPLALGGSGLAREAHNATGVPATEPAKLSKWLPKG